jgi:hypothetical protein
MSTATVQFAVQIQKFVVSAGQEMWAQTGPRYQTREEASAARNRLVRDGQDLVGGEQVRVVEVRS